MQSARIQPVKGYCVWCSTCDWESLSIKVLEASNVHSTLSPVMQALKLEALKLHGGISEVPASVILKKAQGTRCTADSRITEREHTREKYREDRGGLPTSSCLSDQGLVMACNSGAARGIDDTEYWQFVPHIPSDD